MRSSIYFSYGNLAPLNFALIEIEANAEMEPKCEGELSGRSSLMSPKYIKKLTQAERDEFFDSFDAVFCDCDGVIWHTLRDVIPGSAEAIDFLRQKSKKVTFVTNNSISSTSDHLKKFEKCNIKVEKHEIIHPAQAICDYLKSIEFKGLIYCLATTPFKNLLREEGFQLVEEPEHKLNESVHELREAIFSADPVKAVVIDVDFNLTAAKLMRAHVHLKDPECLLIGGAADALIPFGGGDIIGPGPFITVVENSTKRKATILGKPGRDLGEMLKQRYILKDPKRVLFIGDSLNSDVKFGKMCGFQTMIVLSGGTKNHELQTVTEENEMPDYVADTLGDLKVG